MGKPIDHTGKQIGDWTVISKAESVKRNRGKIAMWNCRCKCGTEAKICAQNLHHGLSKRCRQCLWKLGLRKTHGESVHGKTSHEYTVWSNMRRRCSNPKLAQWKNYGGRGISVCDRWQKFENFLADMGRCPEGLTLDRKDNDGNYCKANCRWGTDEEQNNNTRSTVRVEIGGVVKTFKQWCNHLGVNGHTAYTRRASGWDNVAAITTPIRKGNYVGRRKAVHAI